MTAQATPFRTSEELPLAKRSGAQRAFDPTDVLSWVAIVGAVSVIFSVVFRAGIPLRFIGEVLGLVQLVAGAAIIVVGGRTGPEEKRAWRLIGLGIVASGVGQLTRAALGGFVANGYATDAFSILFFVLVGVGLVRLPYVRPSRVGAIRTAIDVVVSMIAMGTVMIELRPAPEGLGWAAPVMQVLLLGAMATAFLRRSLYVRDFRLAFLMLGLVPVLSVGGLAPTTAQSSVLRWAGSMLLFGILAWTLGMSQPRRSMILARPGRKQLVLPTIPLIALGALLTVTLVRGEELTGTLLPWSMLLVSVAMAVRTFAAAQESRHLLGLERDQLLASLSHEIRTPLTAVAGFSQVLSTSWDVIDDLERQELIELIGSEAESLVDIIGDMNALVRSELDAASLELERMQGKNLIAEAIKLVFRLDGQLPVRAEVEPYLELICDRRRMVQVLRALFENALRYGDGRILVVAKRTKTGRVIEVHDNGAGVERRHEKTIWKRFERGEHELNANVPGSGLGLAVVRSIARAHDGDAHYRRSERLGGACFSIELPYDKEAPIERSTRAASRA